MSDPEGKMETQEEEQSDVRRSERTTAGQPGDLFKGFFTDKDPEYHAEGTPHQSQSKWEHQSEAGSHASNKTTDSVVRVLQTETQRKILEHRVKCFREEEQRRQEESKRRREETQRRLEGEELERQLIAALAEEKLAKMEEQGSLDSGEGAKPPPPTPFTPLNPTSFVKDWVEHVNTSTPVTRLLVPNVPLKLTKLNFDLLKPDIKVIPAPDGGGGGPGSSHSSHHSSQHPNPKKTPGDDDHDGGGDKDNEDKRSGKSSSSEGSTSVDKELMMLQLMTKMMDMTSAMNEKKDSGNTKFLARQIHGRDLPQFNGKPEDWPMFISMFENTTKVCDYDNIANLARLQRCLKGEAIDLVRGLMMSPENVPKIIQKLKDMFGNPELVIESLIRAVQATPSVKEEKVETLIKFGTAVTSFVGTVQALKVDGYLTYPLLLKRLEKKLPPAYKLKWREWVTSGSRKESLDEFETWVTNMTMLMRKFYTPAPSPPQKEDKKKKDEKNPNQNQLLVAADPKEQESPQVCPFCPEFHKIYKCNKFKAELASDREKWARQTNRCLKCINLGHFLKDCKSKQNCRVPGCGRPHHTLLHKDVVAPSVNPPTQSPAPLFDIPENAFLNQVLHLDDKRILYKIVPVEIIGPKKSFHIHAILDTGSAFTVIDEDLSNAIGLEGRLDKFQYKGLGTAAHSSITKVVSLKLKCLFNGEEFPITNVRTHPCMDLRGGSFRKSDQNKWPHLRGLDLVNYENARPKMLIGHPHAYLMAPLKVVKSPPNAPVVSLTRLGWTVFGCLEVPGNVDKVQSVLHMEPVESDDALHQLVKSFFATEEFGIRSKAPQSQDEARAEAMVTKTLRRVGERFEIGLLWKSAEVSLPPNREMAEMRLRGIEKKMDRNPEFAAKYCEKFQHYLDSGYINKVPPADLNVKSDRLWYLPHFGVTKLNKPGKLRLVFDAAAALNGVSLNSKLLKGPDELKPLLHVLFKFRERKIAVSADVKEMFHQVQMRKEDWASQRLLWRGMDHVE